MAYTILNQQIFTAAVAGAFAAMNGVALGNGGAPNLAAGYSQTANVAFAFAQAYDTGRGASGASALEIAETEALAYAAWDQRNPTASLNANTAATWAGLAADVLAAVNELLIIVGAGASNPPTAGANFGFITTGAASANGHTVAANILALIVLQAKFTGIFDYLVSAEEPAAAATEVITWVVTSQTGAGAVAVTNTTTAQSQGRGSGTQPTANSIEPQVNNAAGTQSVITGGGGELTQWSSAETIGTAGVGSKFAAGGILQNSVTDTTKAPGSLVPFTIGNNVFLILKITNSATDRVVQSINMYLAERTAI